MKITSEKIPAHLTDISTYPALKVRKSDGAVVLFYGPGSGVCLCGTQRLRVGHHSQVWDESLFAVFAGKINNLYNEGRRL